MAWKPSKAVAIIVVVVCIVCVLVIYKLTVGSKVSSQASDTGPSSLRGPQGSAPVGAGGPGDSHARVVGDEEAVTRPAEDKRPRPPDAGSR